MAGCWAGRADGHEAAEPDHRGMAARPPKIAPPGSGTFLPTGGSDLANNNWLTRIMGGLV